MDDFRKWFETAVDVGAPPMEPPVGDDDDDDDDDWDWEKVERVFGHKITNWLQTSPTAQYIKGKILEQLFNTKPRIKELDVWEADEITGRIPPTGRVSLHVGWDIPEDYFETSLLNFVRGPKSDLWKYMDVDPRQMWNLLDQGDVFDYIYYKVVLAISGVSQIQVDKTQKGWGAEWYRRHQEWLKDKLTIDKYARFVTEQDWMKKFESRVKREIHPEDPKRVQLTLAQDTTRYGGQTYQGKLMADVFLTWHYQIA